jgi:NAD(P)H-hydrate epimerase
MGARVTVIDARSAPDRLPVADLVVDAAFGTGLRRPYEAPDPGGAPVLAVDIPSGIDGSTGIARGRPVNAQRTVTFAALKPGLLLADGRECAGHVQLVDIGLDTSRAIIGHVGDDDLDGWPDRPADAHKYHAAVWVIAGSPAMVGAPRLAASAALRAGSGYVRLSVPGAQHHLDDPWEAVGHPLPAEGWANEVLGTRERIRALVVGPGLGRSDDVRREVAELLRTSRGAVVLDGDALWALAQEGGPITDPHEVVITPHDGEFRSLTGHDPGEDRIAEVRALAARLGAVVLLKGPTTVVADAVGAVRIVTSGDQRLATAGTGDVLAGMIGALLAGGVPALDAAALAAHAHGRAATHGRSVGLVAGDLPELLRHVL